MQPVPLIRAGVFGHFVEAAEEIDAQLLDGLERVHFSPGVLDDSEALIPFEQCLVFIEASARSIGMADFGYQVGLRKRIADLGVFGQLVRHSLTLHEAIATACVMFPALNSGAHLSIERENGVAWLRHRLVMNHPGATQAALYTLPLLIDLVRIAAGRTWLPSAALLPEAGVAAMTDPALIERLRCTDAPESAIAIEADLLSLPLHLNGNGNGSSVRSDPGVAVLTRRFLDGAPARGLLESLEQALDPLLRSNHANLETLAEFCHVSARTLQRVLEREGATFSRLMDRARFHRAHRLLAGSDLKLIEVAYEVGYLEPASFTRAFQRWTGISPSEYRMRHKATSHPRELALAR